MKKYHNLSKILQQKRYLGFINLDLFGRIQHTPFEDISSNPWSVIRNGYRVCRDGN